MAPFPVTELQRRAIGRRAFLSGSWLPRRGPDLSESPARRENVTVVVQARPDRLHDIERDLPLHGVVGFTRGAAPGSLRVEIDQTGAAELPRILDSIVALPGVLAATLAGPAGQGTPA